MAKTSTPPALGTVNGYMPSHFTYKGKRYTFDGTALGLTHAALALGIKPGQKVTNVYGLGVTMTMIPTGGGPRTPGGVWMR